MRLNNRESERKEGRIAIDEKGESANVEIKNLRLSLFRKWPEPSELFLNNG
jgi:hypothetical protein